MYIKGQYFTRHCETHHFCGLLISCCIILYCCMFLWTLNCLVFRHLMLIFESSWQNKPERLRTHEWTRFVVSCGSVVHIWN